MITFTITNKNNYETQGPPDFKKKQTKFVQLVRLGTMSQAWEHIQIGKGPPSLILLRGRKQSWVNGGHSSLCFLDVLKGDEWLYATPSVLKYKILLYFLRILKKIGSVIYIYKSIQYTKLLFVYRSIHDINFSYNK